MLRHSTLWETNSAHFRFFASHRCQLPSQSISISFSLLFIYYCLRPNEYPESNCNLIQNPKPEYFWHFVFEYEKPLTILCKLAFLFIMESPQHVITLSILIGNCCLAHSSKIEKKKPIWTQETFATFDLYLCLDWEEKNEIDMFRNLWVWRRWRRRRQRCPPVLNVICIAVLGLISSERRLNTRNSAVVARVGPDGDGDRDGETKRH